MSSGLHDVAVTDGSMLELACGLAAAIRRVDDLLERYAPPSATATTTTDDGPVLDMLLGLVAVRDRIARELAHVSPVPDTTPNARPLEGSWLR